MCRRKWEKHAIVHKYEKYVLCVKKLLLSIWFLLVCCRFVSNFFLLVWLMCSLVEMDRRFTVADIFHHQGSKQLGNVDRFLQYCIAQHARRQFTRRLGNLQSCWVLNGVCRPFGLSQCPLYWRGIDLRFVTVVNVSYYSAPRQGAGCQVSHSLARSVLNSQMEKYVP
jgi:hypothetical protein